jgi:hypothetical protein
LEALALELSQGSILIFGTSIADIYQELNNRVNGGIGHAGRSP